MTDLEDQQAADRLQWRTIYATFSADIARFEGERRFGGSPSLRAVLRVGGWRETPENEELLLETMRILKEHAYDKLIEGGVLPRAD